VSRPVYSSGPGRLCPECGRPTAACACSRKASAPAGDGIARVRLEVKGRRGKSVTTVTGVPLDEEGLLDLAAGLKRRCGAGGSLKDGVIEVQGDHRDTVMEELQRRGLRAKRAGGR
jgi:translation initiation factor 1